MKRTLKLLAAMLVLTIPLSFCGCPPATRVPDQVTPGPKATSEPEVGEVPIKPMK